MRITKVIGLFCAALICALVLTGASATGEEAAPRMKDEPLRVAIQKGLEYLDKKQDKNSGALEANLEFQLVSTSVAGMAFLSGGNLPGRGLYGRNVELALNFILDKAATPNGYLQLGSSNMYSHGFATLFLAEAYGTMPANSPLQQRVRKALKKSIAMIEKCQSEEGGWWYNPFKETGSNGADISVTVCETNALRAARNCGIAVDKRVVENALKCVTAAQNSSDGGFCYRVSVKGPAFFTTRDSAFPRSCGAVCILQALGNFDSDVTRQGIRYITEKGITSAVSGTTVGYYATYYFSQAMFMAGREYWDKWWPQIRELMLSKQEKEGYWQGEGGKTYGTAIALIVLQMPYRYLPIYQEGLENSKPPQSE